MKEWMIGFGIITEYRFVQKEKQLSFGVWAKGFLEADNETCMDALGIAK